MRRALDLGEERDEAVNEWGRSNHSEVAGAGLTQTAVRGSPRQVCPLSAENSGVCREPRRVGSDHRNTMSLRQYSGTASPPSPPAPTFHVIVLD